MSILTAPSPRVMSPNTSRRRAWHDYTRPAVYLITLTRNPRVTRFADFEEEPHGHSYVAEPPLLMNGDHIENGLAAFLNETPGASILALTILPDYISFVLRNNTSDHLSLSELITRIKNLSNYVYLGYEYSVNEDDDNTEFLNSLFIGGFDDRIARRKSDVERFISYIEDCPRNYILLRRYPDFHRRFRIGTRDGNEFECYGNEILLDDPQIEAVRISSKYSEEELRKLKSSWYRTILNGGVLVSPFVSGAENKVCRWALDNGGRVIKILPNGFDSVFHPDPALLPALESGRLLLIAPTFQSPRLVRPDRTVCMSMNAMAERIAAHTFLSHREE